MEIRKIKLPLTDDTVRSLHAGERVELTGTIWTARDAAHKRFIELLERGEELPFPIKDAVIYYTGPSPAKAPYPTGSAGPTTSYRMDSYTPLLLRLGLRGMVGKGTRSKEVIDAMKEVGAVYFCATGGAGALLASRIKSAETAAFEDLGTEAVRRLFVEDFPVTVAIDCSGGNLYETGPALYLTRNSRQFMP